MKIGVGAHIYWRSGLDLPATVSHVVKDLNFRHVEILCEHPFFENWGTDKADKLKKSLREIKETLDIDVSLHCAYHDMNIASWNIAVRDATIGQLKECIETADYLNSNIVVIHPGFVSSRKYDRQKTFEMMIENLKAPLALAEDLDITLCIENLAMKPKAMGIYPEDMLKIVRGADSPYLKIAFDVAHANTTGINPINFAKKLGKYTRHVHISDNQGKDDHLPIGLGNIDFEGILKLVGKSSLVIEGWAPQNTDYFLAWSKKKLEKMIE